MAGAGMERKHEEFAIAPPAAKLPEKPRFFLTKSENRMVVDQRVRDGVEEAEPPPLPRTKSRASQRHRTPPRASPTRRAGRSAAVGLDPPAAAGATSDPAGTGRHAAASDLALDVRRFGPPVEEPAPEKALSEPLGFSQNNNPMMDMVDLAAAATAATASSGLQQPPGDSGGGAYIRPTPRSRAQSTGRHAALAGESKLDMLVQGEMIVRTKRQNPENPDICTGATSSDAIEQDISFEPVGEQISPLGFCLAKCQKVVVYRSHASVMRPIAKVRHVSNDVAKTHGLKDGMLVLELNGDSGLRIDEAMAEIEAHHEHNRPFRLTVIDVPSQSISGQSEDVFTDAERPGTLRVCVIEARDLPHMDTFGGASHWRDCHFADALSPSLLKHLLNVEGGAAE